MAFVYLGAVAGVVAFVLGIWIGGTIRLTGKVAALGCC